MEELPKKPNEPIGKVQTWLTPEDLSISLNISLGEAKKYIDKYRESHQGHIKNLDMEGWMTTNTLAEQLGSHPVSIKKIADKYIKVNPEYLLKQGAVTYYSPKLVEIIEKNHKKRLEILDQYKDWRSNGALMNELNTDQHVISGIADQYKETNPEYFLDLTELSNDIESGANIYSPELVKIITKEVKTRKETLDIYKDWMTNKATSNIIGTDKASTKRIADKYRESNPEYFKMVPGMTGRELERYSPELINIIKIEIERKKDIFDVHKDWMTNTSISRDLKVAKDTVQSIAEKYRQSNPEYFFSLLGVTSNAKELYSPELIKIICDEIEKIKTIPEVPEGWISNLSISLELKSGQDYITKIANTYRESNPEYFKKFRNVQGKIYDYYSPELAGIIRNEIEGADKPIDGWITNSALSDELHVSYNFIARIANQYKESNPSYFREFKAKSGFFEHYSPELVKLIRQDIRNYREIPAPPSGWVANGPFARELNRFLAESSEISASTIQKMADKYRASNPEYFSEFRYKNRIFEYYSPDLVNLLNNEINNFKKINHAPEGWQTNYNLSAELDEDFLTVKNVADRYRDDHPEYFIKFRVLKGDVYEHYSPDLTLLIKEGINEINKIPKAPEGWLTAGGVANLIGIDPTTAKKRSEKYRNSHPEYFSEFKDTVGRISEHYSSELISRLKEEIGQMLEAPAGWKTNNGLAKELEVDPGTSKKIANNYGLSNPEYFKKYRDKSGQVSLHFSPELVKIIEKEVTIIKEIQKAPEGWKTNYLVSKDLGVAFNTVENEAEKYRESNPEYFAKYRNIQGRIHEHYSPELIEVIKRKIEKVDTQQEVRKTLEIFEAPENLAVKIEDLAKQTGATIEEVEAAIRKRGKDYPGQFGKFKEKK